MGIKNIQLTNSFKKQVAKTIWSIVLFVLVYIAVLAFSLGISALLIYCGFYILDQAPEFVVMLMGVGLMIAGLPILYHVLRFTFKSTAVDRSHFVEITRKQEPELFQLIDEIVTEVQTRHPLKVYLSNDVNASVFYNSNFWSMFFPIRKNLQIGLGLVNSVTQAELKAILAHEFGHFSQKSMKVGSYVYNVNQLLHNMLVQNENYNKQIEKWGNEPGFTGAVITFGDKVNAFTKYILRGVYGVVNKSYLGLSREMEFHADEIAANVAGPTPVKTSLLRLSFADFAFNDVLNFYNKKITKNTVSANIYRDHYDALIFLADLNNLKLKDGFPEITIEEQNKFNKSKLVIKDQWSSHPTIAERLKRVDEIGVEVPNSKDIPANLLFKHIETTQIELTQKLFSTVVYEGETSALTFEEFKAEYKTEILSNTFSKIYNCYYDNKNISSFDPDEQVATKDNSQLSTLFSDANVELVYTALALQNDVDTITHILKKNIVIKTFDYDGKKYKPSTAKGLKEELTLQLQELNAQILKNDIAIFQFFENLEKSKDKPSQLKNLYKNFFALDKEYETKSGIYSQWFSGVQFVTVQTPVEQIKMNLQELEPVEKNLKKEIEILLFHKLLQEEITNEMRQDLNTYCSKKWMYFNGKNYDDDALHVLYAAMNTYAYLLGRLYFQMKKEILSYQESLLS
ncbi:MAG: M48 family metalloprotease [Bacteroidia bacterium]|nr:M48 family metalloprotease [Bacteroidia bacterium]